MTKRVIKQVFVDLWHGFEFAICHPLQTARGLCDEAARWWR